MNYRETINTLANQEVGISQPTAEVGEPSKEIKAHTWLYSDPKAKHADHYYT